MTVQHIVRIGAASALAIGLTLGAGAASAQSYQSTAYDPDGAYTTGEVVVIAPRTVGRSAIGAPIEIVRTSRAVAADDLDLAAPWGARTLRHRIEHAARDACDDLDARYPISDDNGRDCVGAAVRDAMYQVEDRLGFAPPTWPDLG